MNEIARLALLVLGTAIVLTLGAVTLLKGMRPDRRVRAALHRAAGARPDAEICTDEGGAAFSSAKGIVAVAWDKGRWRLAYPVEEVLGAEILVDDIVAARAFRGEGTRGLARIPGQAASVALRLLFDEPGHPDFELVLWPDGGASTSVAGAVREANTWLARMDAIVRRAGGGASHAAAPIRVGAHVNEDLALVDDEPDD